MNDFFDLLNGFRINGDFPIDSRFVVADEAARLAIPVNAVYKGLFTFQADVNLLYIYDGEDQTNVDSAWTSFTVNNIDVANVSFEIAPNGNTIVTLPFENGQQTQFVVQRGEAGPEAQYFIEVIGEFAEDIVVPAPQGGSYDTETRVLDTTGLTAGWFDPFTQQVPALADGNAYYRARFIIIPARITGSVTPTWSSPVQLSGDQGPQGQTGPNGPDGIDGDSFYDVVQTVVPTRGMFTNVQPRKQDHNGLITNAGDPIRLAAGFTGASVTDVVNVTGGDQAGVPTTFQFQSTAENGATTILPQTVTVQPGASGSGSGDVNSTGTIIAGQYAKFNNPTLISGQTGVPGSDITGLSTNGNTDLSTILNDLDSRDVGVADIRVQSQDVVLINGNGAEVGTGFRLLNAVTAGQATPVQSDALFTEFGTKLDTDLTNVASLTTQQQTDFRTAIGAGTGHGGSNITVSATAGVTDTDTNVTYDADDKVDLSPTANQRITQPSGTVLDVRGSFDLETNSGEKALDFSGTSGDIHLEDFNTTTNESNTKVLFDRSSGQLYMNPTSTTLNLPTSDDNKVMRAGGLAIGATSVGHADHSDNNEEAIIEIGYENVEVSTLPLNVETADADAAETFIKRNTNGEIIFSLSNVIQSGDLRPATSAAVNTAISNSGSFNPGGTNTDGFVLTNDGTGAYNWEAATGTSNITVATTGVTDNNPGGVTYNASDKQVDLGLTQDANGDVIVDDKDIILEHTAEIHFHGNGVNPVDEAIIDYNTITNTLEIIPAVDRNVALEVSGTGKAYVGPPGVAANEIVTVGTQTGGGGTSLTERFQPNGATAFTIGTLHTGAAGTAPANSLYFRTASGDNTKLTITDFSQLQVGNQIVFDLPDGTADDSPGTAALTALQNGGTLFISSGTASAEMQVSGIAGNPAVAGGNKRFTISSVTHSFGTVGTAASTSFTMSTEAYTEFYQDDTLVGPRFNEYHFSNSYNAGDFAWSAGELFQCTASYTAPHNQELPQNQPEHWKAVTHQIEIFDSLTALTELNSTGKPTAVITPGELAMVWQDDTASNNGIYLIQTSDTVNYTAGTTAFKLATFGGSSGTNVSINQQSQTAVDFRTDISGDNTSVRGVTFTVDGNGVVNGSVSVSGLGTGGSDGRFSGAPVAAGIATSGVQVSAVGLIHNSQGDAVTVILPTANPTTPFAIGEHVHTTDADGAVTYIITDTFTAANGVVEIIIDGDHRTAWQGATDIFIDRTATPVNTIFAVTTPGAGALQLSDSLINNIQKTNDVEKIALANEAKVDSLLDILTISTAWETQGTYLTTTWPGLITNHTAGQGNSLYTSPTLRVFPDGRYEFSIYASFPTDELPASFTDEFGTATQANKPIAGIAFSSSAYDNIPFPHVLQSEFIRSQPLGTGGTASGYGGRHLVVFGGILTDAQNADRSFIQNASDTFAIYGEYSLYAFYPNNDVYDNFRVGDPAEIFAFTVGIYDLYQLHDMNTDASGDRIGLEYVMFRQAGTWAAYTQSTTKTNATNQTIDTITGLSYTLYSGINGFSDNWYKIKNATITSGALASATKGTVWTTVLTNVGTHASTFNY